MPSFINENYKNFLKNLKAYESKQGNSRYSYYKLYLLIYLNWQVQLRHLNTLISRLQVCILSLRNSCGVLYNYISAKKPGKDTPAEILQLESDYFSVLDTIAKFSEVRDRLFK